MGKWYMTEGQERFGKLKVFKDMEATHAQVHEYVRDNYKFVDNNSTTKNQKIIIENFRNMEDASSILFIQLDKMIDDSRLST